MSSYYTRPINYKLVSKNQNVVHTPMATEESYGIVKIGNGLDVENGVVSVNENELNAVRYDVEQNLTDEQKEQARNNIDAVNIEDYNNLETRVDDLETTTRQHTNQINSLNSTVGGFNSRITNAENNSIHAINTANDAKNIALQTASDINNKVDKQVDGTINNAKTFINNNGDNLELKAQTQTANTQKYTNVNLKADNVEISAINQYVSQGQTITTKKTLNITPSYATINNEKVLVESDLDEINAKLGDCTEENPAADKDFVNSTVQTATANFRGNWEDFASVPADAEEYPLDFAQSRTPTVNDYIAVADASDYHSEEIFTREGETTGYYISANGAIVANADFAYSAELELDNKDKALTLRATGISGRIFRIHCYDENHNWLQEVISGQSTGELVLYGTLPEEAKYVRVSYPQAANNIELYTHLTLGSWRFKYTGNWEIQGKAGWEPEYQLNETPFTMEQLATLNSGLTSEDKEKISSAVQPENLKTINNESIIGIGDIQVQSPIDANNGEETTEKLETLEIDGVNYQLGGGAEEDNLSITKNSEDKIQTVGVIDETSSVNKIHSPLTMAEYEQLTDKDPSTWYPITDEPNIADAVIDQNTGNANKQWTGTKDEYDQIEEKDENTFYNITDDNGGVVETVGGVSGDILLGEGLSMTGNTLSATGGGSSYPYLTDTGITMTDEQNINITTEDPTYTMTTEVSSFGAIATYQEKDPETQEVTYNVMTYATAEGVGFSNDLTNGLAALLVADDPDNNQVGGALLLQNGENMVQLTCGSNNELLVNGQQVGGGKLYQHVIGFTLQSYRCQISPIITNSSNTFTKETLSNWLTENGYVNDFKSLPFTVLSTHNGSAAIYNGLYSYMNTGVFTSLRTIFTNSTLNTENNSITSINLFGWEGNYGLTNFTDTVREL